MLRSGLVLMVSFATQQMVWVESKSVVRMEISSDAWLKYCYRPARQAKDG